MIQEEERNASPLIEHIQLLEKRIHEISDTCVHNNGILCKDMYRFEKILSELVSKIADIANFYYKEKKTPHKCPICNGNGKVETPNSIRFDILMGAKDIGVSACSSCEGKGILWS